MKDPVCLLKKALYGHPDSVTLWEKHRDESMEKIQFKPVQGWASCFMHVGLRVSPAIYVDAGPIEAWRKPGN